MALQLQFALPHSLTKSRIPNLVRSSASLFFGVPIRGKFITASVAKLRAVYLRTELGSRVYKTLVEAFEIPSIEDMMKPIFVLSLIIVQVFATSRGDTSLSAVKSAFDAANIPSNASLTFNPSVLSEVTFPETNRPAINLHAGIPLPRNETAGPPTFGVLPHGSLEIPKGRFVVAMVDLDAPTPQSPTNAQIRHFLGGDFSLGPVGLDGIAPLTNSTPALSQFLQPTPPAGSDPHRYVFLLFHQPATFDQQTFVNSSTSISLFNISLFADEVGLGHPLGGTFMRVGPDPSASDV